MEDDLPFAVRPSPYRTMVRFYPGVFVHLCRDIQQQLAVLGKIDHFHRAAINVQFAFHGSEEFSWPVIYLLAGRRKLNIAFLYQFRYLAWIIPDAVLQQLLFFCYKLFPYLILFSPHAAPLDQDIAANTWNDLAIFQDQYSTIARPNEYPTPVLVIGQTFHASNRELNI